MDRDIYDCSFPITWIALRSYFYFMKNTYMSLCYRFKTCCNMKNTFFYFGSSYYIFLSKMISLIYSALSWEKKRCIFFIFIFSNFSALHTRFPFFNDAKRLRGVQLLILLRIVFFESIHFQGFFAFAVGLDTDKEIFK